MNILFDIYVAGQWKGNVSGRSFDEAAPKARLLLQQSNPKIFEKQFTLTPRLESLDFDL